MFVFWYNASNKYYSISAPLWGLIIIKKMYYLFL